MLRVTQNIGFGIRNRPPVVITQTANPAPLSVGGSTGTFSSISIGESSPNRVIAVCIGWRGTNRALTSFSINTGSGAVNMTLGAGNVVFASKYSAIYYLAVPESATTATFVATFPGNLGNFVKIVVYSVTGPPITGISAYTDTSSDMDATDPLTVSVSVPDRSGAIAVSVGSVDTSVRTWTGLTKDADEDMGQDRYSTAFGTTSGSYNVTCQGTSDGEDGTLACISFIPLT